MSEVLIKKTKDYLVVKIPLKSVAKRRADISLHSQEIVDEAVEEGLMDIADGRIFGPFKSIKEFKKVFKAGSK